jgi:hypothetical protein
MKLFASWIGSSMLATGLALRLINARRQLLQKLQKCPLLLLVVLLASLGAGCQTIQDHSLTCALWKARHDSSECRPVAPLELKLFASENPPDVLVEYNAVSQRYKGVRRLAFFLNANRDSLAAGNPPRFVNPRCDVGLTPIVIVKRPAETNSPAFKHATFAVCSENSFILYQPESQPDDCVLPCLADGAPWPYDAAMPVAFLGDVVVVSTVVGVVAGFACIVGLCESNSSWSP